VDEDSSVESVDVDGLRIAYERQGTGPPLVLLHGLPGNRRLWRPQLDGLSDEFTVVAWDAPGNGESSDPVPPADLTGVARVLRGFVAALELGRPHVLGLSWGGGLALELARIEPVLPRSLVLASAYAGWAGSLPADEVARRVDAYERAARSDPVASLRSFAPGYFSPSAPPELFEEAVSMLADYHPEPFAALARSFGETDLGPMLGSIGVPTLVLSGGADVRAPLPVARALHDAIPGSELVVLAGVGHVGNLEAPDRFDDAVRRFLRTVPAPP
jgi:pimeloyl-ACP methyl ester carboxylesterase